jgi:hypothetical protein
MESYALKLLGAVLLLQNANCEQQSEKVRQRDLKKLVKIFAFE